MNRSVEELCDRVRDLPVWNRLVSDTEIHPEVRLVSGRVAVTFYYRGAALLRELHVEDGRLEGSTHVKYLPCGDGADPYVRLACDDERGIVAADLPNMIDLGNGDNDRLRRYKAQLAAHNASVRREGDLIGRICSGANLIVDQEVVILREEGGSDRIDLAVAHPNEPRISLVEVKRINDARLYPTESGRPPDVVDQLERYRDAIDQHAPVLASRFRQAIEVKQRLGIGSAFDGWSGLGNDVVIDSKVLLAVGGCDREAVRTISQGEGIWSWCADQGFREDFEVVAFGREKTLFPRR